MAVSWRDEARPVLDVGLATAAALVVALSVTHQISERGGLHPFSLLAVALLVLMGRYPLVLTNRAGDAVIGFEASVLVFLACSTTLAEALTVWSVGMLIEHLVERRPLRVRVFNASLTITGGALLVAVASLVPHDGPPRAQELAVVLVGCAVYFAYDMLMTATWLALDARQPLSSALQWRTVPLGLVCFVAVDSIGFLASVLERRAPTWTLGLLLVPIVTILLAVDAVSRARLSQQRLSALFQAAAQAPDWSEDADLERTLVDQATSVLRHTTGELRTAPAGPGELGCPLVIGGREVRQLVVRRAAHAQPFDDDDRRALEALTSIAAASLDRHRLNDEMTHLAGHDSLTGLANRRVFGDRLDQALGPDGATPGVSVLFCDLDGFKAVNDSLGHHAGDHLLGAVALRLRECLDPDDLIARLGGDEFAVLITDVDSPARALRASEAIQACFVDPFALDGELARVGVSIGVAHASRGASGTDVLRGADTAMYRAKALGKGRTEQFVPRRRDDAAPLVVSQQQRR
ncbi:MAG: GGDEF domain-containing protein [Actinomycetota bacterium]